MRYLLIAVLLIVSCSISWAAHVEEPGINLESVSFGMTLEENPQGAQTSGLCENLCFCNETYRLKLSLEYYSDGYDRGTIYAGKKDSPTMGLVRWDDISRLWVGANHVQKVGEGLTLILRPMKGMNTATADRAYLLLDYSSGNRWGALFCGLAIADDHKAEDYYLGPKYTAPAGKGKFSLWIGPHLTKDGFYADLSYSLAF